MGRVSIGGPTHPDEINRTQEQTPGYSQISVQPLENVLRTITKDAAAVISSNQADMSQSKTAVIDVYLLSSANGVQVTLTVTPVFSPDGGNNWYQFQDSAGNDLEFTLTCSSSTVPTTKCLRPPVECIGGLLAVKWFSTSGGAADSKVLGNIRTIPGV